jgi:fluoride exporter
MLARILLVALGGGAGSALRYVTGLLLVERTSVAWLPTLAVNVVGSFAIGVVMAAWPEPSLARLALTTGLLGGFTTYSAFGHESWSLIRHGDVVPALGYVALTVVACLVACALGARLGGA